MSTTTTTTPEILEELAVQNQAEFDRVYITASEIMKQLGISRPGFLYGRRAGKLPPPIVVNDGRLMIWRREDIAEQLKRWSETKHGDRKQHA